MKNFIYISLAICVTVFCIVFDLWDFAEPLICFASMSIGMKTYQQTKKAKAASFDTNNNDADCIVAIQINCPMVQAISAQIGKIDHLIDIENVLGKKILESEYDYRTIVGSVYKVLAQNQNQKIHLFVSGPSALNLMIGQIIQTNLYNVVVYGFDIQTKKYQPLPQVDISWRM